MVEFKAKFVNLVVCLSHFLFTKVPKLIKSLGRTLRGVVVGGPVSVTGGATGYQVRNHSGNDWSFTSQDRPINFYTLFTLVIYFAGMGKTKPGFYAVAIGRKSGIYNTWDECKAQVTGFANARYKKFATIEECRQFVAQNSSIEKAEPVTNQPENTRYYAALRPNDPVWMKAHGTAHEPKEPELTTFSQRYSGKPIARNVKFSRGELMGNGNGFSSASAVLLKSTLTEAPGPSSSTGGARNFSTSTADFRRQLRVTEARVTNNKRKLSSDGDAMAANKKVKNPETFQKDGDGYIIVFTDGACKENGRKGAEAGIGIWFGDNHELNISEPVIGRQTNNTAEIQAAERAILQAKNAGIDKLVIQTDSQFVINCVTKWMAKWKQNGWKLTDGKAVKNRHDLEKLTAAMDEMEIKWSYVPGHKGHYGNEQADRLAVAGAAKAQKLSK